MSENADQVANQFANQVGQFTRLLSEAVPRFIRFVASALSFPVLMILRRNFGERFLISVVGLLGVFFVAPLYALSMDFYTQWVTRDVPRWGRGQMEADAERMRNVLWVFLGACALMYVLHVLLLLLRNRRKVLVHSRYGGDPLPIWRLFGFGYRGATRLGEPALCLAIAIGLISFAVPHSRWIAIYFGIVAFSMVLEAIISMLLARTKLLDTLDGQIEAKQLALATEGWREPGSVRTQGYVVPSVMKKQTPEERLDYVRAFHHLNPALRDLIEQSHQEKDVEELRPEDAPKKAEQDPPSPEPPASS